jgi:hypothetical protein
MSESISIKLDKIKLDKMMEELQKLSGDPTLLLCLYQIFQVIIGLGICHLVPPCFNEKLVEDTSSTLRETGISSSVPITDPDLWKATLCFYNHGCPKCQAICCLNDLLVLPKEENALLNPRLCESVSRCVLGGAGIFNISLLFALLRTSPDFREDSLILFALENCVKKDKRSETLEIAKMFFKATDDLRMDFLFSEPRDSAEKRNTRFANLRRIELEVCREKYAKDIARIQEEKAKEKAAALEEKKSKMQKCYICFGDPIESPPVFFPITCEHKICCEKCSNDGGEKLNHRCPVCHEEFTDDNIWYR